MPASRVLNRQARRRHQHRDGNRPSNIELFGDAGRVRWQSREIFRTSVFRLRRSPPHPPSCSAKAPAPARGEGRPSNLIQRNDARSICPHHGPCRTTQGSRAMTVQEKPYPVVSLVVDTFGEWLKHRRELKEMREMDAANFGRIASELRTVFRRSGGAGPSGAACRRRAAEDADRARHRPGRSGAERAPRAARHGTRLLTVQPQAPMRPRSRRRHRRCALSRSIAAMPTRSTASARG